MANDFSKKLTKPIKNNGSYVFADFSEGLYLLDTPRGLGEQLASLAMLGGRNVWSEKGALVPQYGYMLKGALPETERIISVTKDSKSSASFFIVTLSGRVYLYTASQGLKKYKTELGLVSEDCLTTRSNNSMIMYNEGAGIMFGDYYTDSSEVIVDSNVKASDFGNYVTLTIPMESKDYYWISKKIHLGDAGEFTVVSMRDVINTIPTAFTLSNLATDVNWILKGQIKLDGTEKTIDIADGTNISVATEIHEGTETTITTSTLRYECYKATKVWDEGRNMPSSGYFYLPKNPAIGTNVLVANSNYTQTNDPDILQPTYAALIPNFNVYEQVAITSGNVATYSTLQYTNRNHYQLTRYKAGDLYDVTTETITEPEYTTQTLTFNLPTETNATQSFTTANLANGVYDILIVNNPTDNTITVRVMSGDTIVVESTLSSNDLICRLLEGKSLTDKLDLFIDGKQDNIIDASFISVNASPSSTSTRNSVDDIVDVSEKTYIPIDFIYYPEEQSEEEISMIPILMESVANRLIVVNFDGTIFYSAVGVFDNFEQSNGAGYFRGFYNDNSVCLALDDYLDGILITKQNGLYYAKISDNVSVDSVSGSATTGLTVVKVADIGQQYASDHVIVREKVYAYDSNSCSIVLAVTQNVFGSVLSGKTVVSAEYLNAQDLGISSTKRHLTYVGESDCLILYYGEQLNKGLVLTNQGSLFPRELDKDFETYIQFNQGVIAITKAGHIVQDFQKGTIVLNITPIVQFEAIGLKDNRCICSSILEVTELNGIEYNVTTYNTGASYQHIRPYINYGVDAVELPPLIYSDKNNLIINDSYELTSRWADKKSNVTRIYAPMSGRNGVALSFEFAKNQSFCLAALRLPDFSQGE